MLSFAAPWWLAGLLLVPLMRWWHRGGRHRRTVPVARLSLWQGAAAGAAAAGERQPPDPAWRRRALLAALLCLALAGPEGAKQRRRITLWIDDSSSMLVREAGGTRLELGIARARAMLDQTAPADVEVRALGNPWRPLGTLDGERVVKLSADAGRGAASAPPLALLVPDRLHWLVTDGVKDAVRRWPGDHRPDQVVQIAGDTRNVGLRRISALRSAGDPQHFGLLIELANGGTVAETRELSVMANADEAHRSTYRLEPGTSVQVRVESRAATQVQARLTPGDALAEDDRIDLDLAPLRRRRVAVDPGCAAPLVAAITAHPALAPTDIADASAEVALDCGAGATAPDRPTLRLLADRIPMRPTGPLQWAATVDRSRRLVLDTDSLRLAARLELRPEDTLLLAAGDAALIVRRTGTPALVETGLDFTAATRSAEGTALPLLVNLLLELLLGERLLDTSVELDRGPESARVVPDPRVLADAGRPVAKSAAAAAAASPGPDATRPLLLIAVLVLLWETVSQARRTLRRAP